MRPILVLAAVMALPAWCGEYAVLCNGFRLPAERHEQVGTVVRLITGAAATEIPADQIARFEPDDQIPPPPLAPLAPAPNRDRQPAAPDARQLVRGSAERHGLPPEFVDSVARAESGYRAGAISPKGAIGVMQLMPQTAAGLAANPFDPAENIEAGARLLRDLLVKYDGSAQLALAAYNAGSGAVDRHGGVPPYRETRLYVDRVIRDYLRRTAQKGLSTQSIE
jgi:soluble lytic murein transglycosylase-like protein